MLGSKQSHQSNIIYPPGENKEERLVERAESQGDENLETLLKASTVNIAGLKDSNKKSLKLSTRVIAHGTCKEEKKQTSQRESNIEDRNNDSHMALRGQPEEKNKLTPT